MTTDTRTDAERRYDALKDGSAYVKPADDELPAEVASGEISLLRYAARWLDQQRAGPYPELRAQIDAAPDLVTKQRLICRMADQVLGLADDAADDLEATIQAVAEADRRNQLIVRAGAFAGHLTHMLMHELERAHAERLLTLLEAIINPAPVRIAYDWLDEATDELNHEGRGVVAYTNYLAGQSDNGIAEITFSHRPIEVTAGTNAQIVYMFHRDELPLSEVEATLPNLLALLASPTVHAMRVLHEACEAHDARH